MTERNTQRPRAPSAGAGEAQPRRGTAGLVAATRHLRHFVPYVAARFMEDNCLRVASSLSYTSLLALVPFAAVTFAILAAFPAFEQIRYQIQGFIFANLLPTAGEMLGDYFDTFVANTGKLTTAGIIGLVVTSVLMLEAIESALNDIFRVARKRPLGSRLLLYWTLVTLGPLLLGFAVSMTTYVFALTHFTSVDAGLENLAVILPTAALIIILTLCFLLVPFRPVGFLNALVGGVIAGVFLTLLRIGFVAFLSHTSAYQTIYGALATLPILLIWMYLGWAVVLFGGVVTASLGEWRGGEETREAVRARTESDAYRVAAAVALVGALVRASQDGRGALGSLALEDDSGSDSEFNHALLERLAGAGIIAETIDERWVLARDPDHVTLWDLLAALDLDLSFPDGDDKQLPDWPAGIVAALRDGERTRRERLAVPLTTLLDGDAGSQPGHPLRPVAGLLQKK